MNKKERKLTSAEQKRKEAFEKLCGEMEQSGYWKKDLTVGIVKANILSFVIMLPFAAAVLIGAYFIIKSKGAIDFSLSPLCGLVFLLAMCVLVVLHEAIHGLTWGIFAKGHLKAISFGVIWSMLTPYCTCNEPLTKRQYIIGSAMPTLILGFGLAAVAAAAGNVWLLVLSVIMIFGGGGDFLIILKLLMFKTSSDDVLYYDHPYECGLVVFEKSKR